ncbi:MAG TPA: PAS domain S-box protein, partial [Gemmataceae bacterium]|nr:PAS domain S-box protein [Gemmataceae bacterium]
DVQKKVVSLLHFALNRGGYLFLGPSETIGRQVDLFEPLQKKWRIFRRIGPNRPDRVDFPVMPREKGEAKLPPMPGRKGTGFAELTQQLLLEEFAPTAVLINRRYEILYFFGPTMRFLDQPSGEPTQDLLTLAREGLRVRVRAAVHKAVQENRLVAEHGIRLQRNGESVLVRLTVRPIHAPKAPDGMLLVTFMDEPEPAPSPAPPKGKVNKEEAAVRQLEYDLKATREELQGTIEELESANEELKAANEEVMSMNEELQSANEELETSKEELQSLNEELNTVNSQLQDKVDELQGANDDISNLLNCTDIGTVFLDTQFHIRRFTPAANQLFNLIGGDVGRPLADIAQKFHDPELLGDARHVLQKLAPVEKEVEVEGGRCYLRHIVPYRTKDDRIEGVVVTFVDITERKRIAEALLEGERRFRVAVEAAPNAMIMVDAQGQILLVNSQTEKLFGYQRKELAGQPVEMLVPERLRAQHRHDRTLFMSDPQARPMGQGRDLFGRRKDGTEFPVEIGLAPVKIGEDRCVLAGIVDITQRKAAEAELRQLNQLLQGQLAEATWSEQRRLGQELHDTVGQELTGLSMIAHSLERKLQSQKLPDAAQMAEVSEGLQKVIGQVREISRGMIPVEVDAESFSSALADLASQTGQRHGIECALECDGAVAVHDNQAAVHLYRIAQEAITNAIKHGRAKNIKLALEEKNQHLV